MKYYIGLDVGTSGMKAMLINEDGIVKIVSREYPLSFPHPGWSEQNPDDWFEAGISAIGELVSDIDKSAVRAISFSGQMHGLVMLGSGDSVLRPAILWNDGRSENEVDYLNSEIGKDFLLDNTGNIAFAGFTAPKLLWVKNNEPGIFAKAEKICLPKDYVAYKLSGVFATDVSDAAGTLYFDTEKRRWSKPMLDILGIDEGYLPAVYESSEPVGTLKPELARSLGLSDSVKIVIGAGDNAASAIGTATLADGECNISLGTSGTVFVCSDSYNCDRENAIHSFCSANGRYHYLACTLTAASCQKWWVEEILKTGYDSDLSPYRCKSDVMFLPYLMGERSPVNDTGVRGLFTNLSMNTAREEMTLAVLEGVAFSLRQNIEIIKSLGVDIKKSKVCGGGARNRFWLQILSDALGIELEIPALEHGGVLGACVLAARGDGCDILFDAVTETIKPDISAKEYYDNKYAKYLKLYPLAREMSKG